eukprot:880873-Amphidinium_carterae.3
MTQTIKRCFSFQHWHGCARSLPLVHADRLPVLMKHTSGHNGEDSIEHYPLQWSLTTHCPEGGCPVKSVVSSANAPGHGQVQQQFAKAND